jgi:hypothetical protein
MTLVERLRSSAAAFRENCVFTSDGDGVLLTVQADECDEAADALEAAEKALDRSHRMLAILSTQSAHQSLVRRINDCMREVYAALSKLRGTE